MADHPLVPWLKRRKLKPYIFAKQIGMPSRTLYSHLSGKLLNPSLKAMAAIEEGTEGRITVKRQSAWFRALEPLEEPDDEAPDSPEPDEAEEPDQPIDEDMIDEPFGDEP